MGIYGDAEGLITFTPAVVVNEATPAAWDTAPSWSAGDPWRERFYRNQIDERFLPTDSGQYWARFVLNLNDLNSGLVGQDAVSANALAPAVPESMVGVNAIVFEVAEFAQAHPELTFAGFIEYDDDSGRFGDCWRFTVRRGHQDANRVFLTRQLPGGRWPEPSEYATLLPENRWPSGW
jgi:hypothetical protein